LLEELSLVYEVIDRARQTDRRITEDLDALEKRKPFEFLPMLGPAPDRCPVCGK
jgi:hypothetical protein